MHTPFPIGISKLYQPAPLKSIMNPYLFTNFTEFITFPGPPPRRRPSTAPAPFPRRSRAARPSRPYQKTTPLPIDKIPFPGYNTFIRGCGGIGIRARLRGVSSNGYGFKSRQPHQTNKIRTRFRLETDSDLSCISAALKIPISETALSSARNPNREERGRKSKHESIAARRSAVVRKRSAFSTCLKLPAIHPPPTISAVSPPSSPSSFHAPPGASCQSRKNCPKLRQISNIFPRGT